MARQDSQKIDIHTTETGFQYHRGPALSIFRSDRREDVMALICACLIALGVYANVNYGWGFADLRALVGL
jgi:hypothetical protein